MEESLDIDSIDIGTIESSIEFFELTDEPSLCTSNGSYRKIRKYNNNDKKVRDRNNEFKKY